MNSNIEKLRYYNDCIMIYKFRYLYMSYSQYNLQHINKMMNSQYIC